MPLCQASQSSTIYVIESVNPGINMEVVSTSNIPVENPSIFFHSNCNDNPPSYEEAVNPNVPPPSYNFLFGPVTRMQTQFSNGLSYYERNFCLLLLRAFGCIIIIGLIIFFPICKIFIGGLYINDCPQGEYIPVYLLVSGSVRIFTYFLPLLLAKGGEHKLFYIIESFSAVWTVMGSMWVYNEYEPNYDPALGKYCNKTLYLFAFWTIPMSFVYRILCFCKFSRNFFR